MAKRKKSDREPQESLAGHGPDLSAEEGAVAASSPVERRAGMMEGPSQARIFIPRDDPSSWDTESVESAPAVPRNSKLIDTPISELESRYNVNIQVREGDPKVLKPYASLLVTGLGSAVDAFTEDVVETN